MIERLQAKGIKVIAAANPLRGLKSDSSYVAALIDEIAGPVLAVAHSYGGAVISNAATGKSNVVGLVFVAGFAPDEGEVLLEVTGTSKDSVLGTALVPHQYAIEGGTLTEFTIDPAKARDAFASDLTDTQANVVGTVQRPTADLAFASLEDSPSRGPPTKVTVTPTGLIVAPVITE